MRILIVSDTHGDLTGLNEILKAEEVDSVFHLGDSELEPERLKRVTNVPVYMVRGNCDIFSDAPDVQLIKAGKYKFLLTHGHRFNAKRDYSDMVRKARNEGADYVFFGHTHRQENTEIDGITLINPGSLTYPRGGGASYGILEISDSDEITYTQKTYNED